MEQVREVKKSFCVLSAAYLVIGVALLVWPDISVRAFCYLFGIGMIIFGCAHLILYFTKDRLLSVMQMNMVAGVIGVATGAYILIKMEYMLEIIPFALGIVALLGAVVKLQHALDLRRLKAGHWQILLLFSAVLFALGCLLIANPFESIQLIVLLIGISLIIDGVGNLLGIFWISYLLKHLNHLASSVSYEMTPASEAAQEATVSAEASTIVSFPARNNTADDGEE